MSSNEGSTGRRNRHRWATAKAGIQPARALRRFSVTRSLRERLRFASRDRFAANDGFWITKDFGFRGVVPPNNPHPCSPLRRKLAEERLEVLITLRALNLEVDPEGAVSAFDRVSELAESHGLSIYDATQVELALRENLPLGTCDEALRRSARGSGVSLLLD